MIDHGRSYKTRSNLEFVRWKSLSTPHALLGSCFQCTCCFSETGGNMTGATTVFKRPASGGRDRVVMSDKLFSSQAQS